MSKETASFLEAEQTARDLVSTLKQLQSETTSYKTATGTLEETRKRLAALIDSTQQAAVGTNQVIQTLKQIGAPEIITQLNKLRPLILITLGLSAIAVIIGTIALFR